MIDHGVEVLDGFLFRDSDFLDKREGARNMQDLLRLDDCDVPDGFIAYVQDEDKYYKFKNSNSIDKRTRRWRELTFSGSGGNEPIVIDETLIL